VAQVNTNGSVNMASNVGLVSNATIPLFTPTGSLLTVAVSSGGSANYVAGDILALDAADGGATGVGGTVTVLTVSAGVVQTVSVLAGGSGYNSGLAATVYATTGGSGTGDCTISVSEITPETNVEISVKSVAASMIANVLGAQQGTVSLIEGNANILWKDYCPPWTAIAAGEGKTAYFPINMTYRPTKILRVRYNAILNATTAAVNVVWSRGGA
jgi:hypothetical protein